MTRLSKVATVAVATATSLVCMSSAASARTPETWTEAEPRSVLETLGLFVGIPLGLFFLIVLLTMASSTRRAPRYRPDQDWWAEPVWMGADEKPTTDVAAEGTGDGGGASGRW